MSDLCAALLDVSAENTSPPLKVEQVVTMEGPKKQLVQTVDSCLQRNAALCSRNLYGQNRSANVNRWEMCGELQMYEFGLCNS
jgi:hypothetical protein